LQAREETIVIVSGFPDSLLWEKPAGVASAGFHLQHLSGVLDRLFTYARNESLNSVQLKTLSEEGKKSAEESQTTSTLLNNFKKQVDIALEQLRNTNESTLLEIRGVGRAQIPSTIIGLLMHAAEHTQRHVGQLLVTVRVLNAGLKLK
jgi:uncharacterized damage-inducible protein DinB